jgi:hypothetical protein
MWAASCQPVTIRVAIRVARSITVARYSHPLAGAQVGDVTHRTLAGRGGGEVAAGQVRAGHRLLPRHRVVRL